MKKGKVLAKAVVEDEDNDDNVEDEIFHREEEEKDVLSH